MKHRFIEPPFRSRVTPNRCLGTRRDQRDRAALSGHQTTPVGIILKFDKTLHLSRLHPFHASSPKAANNRYSKCFKTEICGESERLFRTYHGGNLKGYDQCCGRGYYLSISILTLVCHTLILLTKRWEDSHEKVLKLRNFSNNLREQLHPSRSLFAANAPPVVLP
jgi:hypothetical protein